MGQAGFGARLMVRCEITASFEARSASIPSYRRGLHRRRRFGYFATGTKLDFPQFSTVGSQSPPVVLRSDRNKPLSDHHGDIQQIGRRYTGRGSEIAD